MTNTPSELRSFLDLIDLPKQAVSEVLPFCNCLPIEFPNETDRLNRLAESTSDPDTAIK